jgi:hypothetical protein
VKVTAISFLIEQVSVAVAMHSCNLEMRYFILSWPIEYVYAELILHTFPQLREDSARIVPQNKTRGYITYSTFFVAYVTALHVP